MIKNRLNNEALLTPGSKSIDHGLMIQVQQ